MANLIAKKGKDYFLVLIDEEDEAKVKTRKWYLDSDGYVVTVYRKDGKKVNVKLHSLLLGKRPGFEIDHINRNKLDNRRSNLRYVTHHENTLNRSRGVGVSWRSDKRKWRARIKFKGEDIHLGHFDTKTAALLARGKAAKEYFGRYAFV